MQRKKFQWLLSRLLLSVLAGVMVLSCSKRTQDVALLSPKDVLKAYVETTFGVQSKEDLKRLTANATGPVLDELKALESSDDLFKEQFLSQKRKFVSMKIRDERVNGDKASIIYEINYLVHTSENRDSEYTIKKQADLVKVIPSSVEQAEGTQSLPVWRLHTVQNIKTVLENKE